MKLLTVKNVENILIFRERILPESETFIRSHYESLVKSRWNPLLVGLTRVESPLTTQEDVLLFDNVTRLRQRIFDILRFDFKIYNWLKEVKPALIHAHFGSGAVKILPLARMLNIPLVVSFHGVDINVLPNRDTFQGKLYRRRLKGLFKYADGLVANSHFLAQRIEQLGGAPEKIKVIPPHFNLVSETCESPSVDLRRGVLFVGRLVPVKGGEDALRSYALLPAELQKEHPLILAGDGMLMKTLKTLASELAINVEFRGVCSREEIRELMLHSAVLLNPSKVTPDGATESFGIVFAEAALAQLPVVSYDSGAVSEIVLNKVTGLLADEGRFDVLADHLAGLLEDSITRMNMGINAAENLVEKFSPDRRDELVNDLYRQILREKI
ncbi:glycosyl transferase family 1 [Glutamicibacter uratoxydans]|uniref:D-inositol 3-phosphate glycosyltransferase n=1 Tax=Glutamicibacter uratoxydans TaxID=43667 RepID=A0A4Y4DZU3_GLUUR|nr:glycosyltransferase [Glutamicibacter uratoxydans]GED07871.1 glycosyl transferase family 1 [Glutamicibacter uratoxydans]